MSGGQGQGSAPAIKATPPPKVHIARVEMGGCSESRYQHAHDAGAGNRFLGRGEVGKPSQESSATCKYVSRRLANQQRSSAACRLFVSVKIGDGMFGDGFDCIDRWPAGNHDDQCEPIFRHRRARLGRFHRAPLRAAAATDASGAQVVSGVDN